MEVYDKVKSNMSLLHKVIWQHMGKFHTSCSSWGGSRSVTYLSVRSYL